MMGGAGRGEGRDQKWHASVSRTIHVGGRGEKGAWRGSEVARVGDMGFLSLIIGEGRGGVKRGMRQIRGHSRGRGGCQDGKVIS